MVAYWHCFGVASVLLPAVVLVGLQRSRALPFDVFSASSRDIIQIYAFDLAFAFTHPLRGMCSVRVGILSISLSCLPQ